MVENATNIFFVARSSFLVESSTLLLKTDIFCLKNAKIWLKIQIFSSEKDSIELNDTTIFLLSSIWLIWNIILYNYIILFKSIITARKVLVASELNFTILKIYFLEWNFSGEMEVGTWKFDILLIVYVKRTWLKLRFDQKHNTESGNTNAGWSATFDSPLISPTSVDLNLLWTSDLSTTWHLGKGETSLYPVQLPFRFLSLCLDVTHITHVRVSWLTWWFYLPLLNVMLANIHTAHLILNLISCSLRTFFPMFYLKFIDLKNIQFLYYYREYFFF